MVPEALRGVGVIKTNTQVREEPASRGRTYPIRFVSCLDQQWWFVSLNTTLQHFNFLFFFTSGPSTWYEIWKGTAPAMRSSQATSIPSWALPHGTGAHAFMRPSPHRWRAWRAAEPLLLATLSPSTPVHAGHTDLDQKALQPAYLQLLCSTVFIVNAIRFCPASYSPSPSAYKSNRAYHKHSHITEIWNSASENTL